ncbi:2OG-Fe(II) oxygenase [Curvivirga sp.]|uniref:2OG-Fe(II) oxygenase n=1 Tax=Curvivirga sp. TaxID=2856848 RepID=UPI003B5AE30A
MKNKILSLDWQKIGQSLHEVGFAHLPALLTETQCQELRDQFHCEVGYRKTVEMARYRFGRGCYKYWDYPLPGLVENLRKELYPHLVPVANDWMEKLGLEQRYPNELCDFIETCYHAGQNKPTPLILEYAKGGYNTLHQDLYGEVYFPIQVACFLSQPERDYCGGEFVLTEQIPRAQSKVTVLKPNLGDLIIFATNFKPMKGIRGYYQAKMRHGVSQVHEGHRYAMGIIFHDALK